MNVKLTSAGDEFNKATEKRSLPVLKSYPGHRVATREPSRKDHTCVQRNALRPTPAKE